jgi:hypothetical protein
MRRLYRALVFAGFVGVFAAPVAASPTAEDTRDTAAAQAPVAVQRVAVPATGMRDEAAMVLVGTMLIGLAAAVRRAA